MFAFFEFITKPLRLHLLPLFPLLLLLSILPISMIITALLSDHVNHYFKQ